MNYTISDPKGIDKQIQIIQNSIYNNIKWNNIDVFGRIYRNVSESKGMVPEAYIGDGEYRDTYMDDSKNAIIFFTDDVSHKFLGGGYYEAEVKIIFSVNIEKIKNSKSRTDSEIQIEALKIIQKHKIFKLKSIEKTIEKILNGFNTQQIKLMDMQPYHMFAVVGDLKYKINC